MLISLSHDGRSDQERVNAMLINSNLLELTVVIGRTSAMVHGAESL
jgi:hypothetical protein